MRRGAVFIALAILIVAVGVGITQKHNLDAQHEREAQLHAALASIRHAIADYHSKHQRNPASLHDLGVIPVDPITHSNATWKSTVEESVSVDDFQPGTAKASPTVVDVHSGASGNDSSGRPFADY